MKPIPYARQSINQKDIDTVVSVLKSEFLTQGHLCNEFESALSKYVNAKYCVVTNSGTSSLYIAYKALGIGEGDIVWTTPNTFVATANCALACGAKVDFVDINLSDFNMCVNKLEGKLAHAEKCGKLPKLLTVVHFAGTSANLKEINDLCQKYDIKIVEDASHALGATYEDAKIGCCQFSDITITSFHPVKIITTGEGGAAFTNCELTKIKMEKLRAHGIIRAVEQKHKPADEIWNYEQVDFGLNFRITEIQCALGISQLDRLDAFVQRRQKIASRYFDKLNTTGYTLVKPPINKKSAFHLFPILLDRQSSRSQTDVINFLAERQIKANIHYIPVYRHSYYQQIGFKQGYCPVAEDYFKRTISIPMFAGLSSAEQNHVCEVLNSFFR